MPPSPLHEALRELFAKSPELILPLLRHRLGLRQERVSPMDSEQTDPRMAQLLPDAVLGFPDGEQPETIVIVEVQLAIEAYKRRIWPQYVAAAYGRYGARVEVLVVTPDPQVEAWAARPIKIGARNAVEPIVLGPAALPLLSADEVRSSPALAVVSTLAHMRDAVHVRRTAQQALWTFEALAAWPGDADGRLADIMDASLSDAVRAVVEELMRTEKYEYKSDFAKKYFAEGREQGLEQGLEQGEQKGRVAALLLVLESRDVVVDEGSMQRISAEHDAHRLEDWTRRAATATRIEDVFGES
jgi:hypothetical protein